MGRLPLDQMKYTTNAAESMKQPMTVEQRIWREARSLGKVSIVLLGTRQCSQDGDHIVRPCMIRLREAGVGNRSSEQSDGMSSAKDI